jgi:hypothetical protein
MKTFPVFFSCLFGLVVAAEAVKHVSRKVEIGVMVE